MNLIARALVNTKAVHIEPNEDKYFTWTSGRRSPIYCDNRQLISYVKERKMIVEKFCELIQTHFSDIELIAGTATAGIPWAAWIADQLELPMIYIRSKPKDHGLKTALEGHFHANQKTLIIEDLVSTGKSSLEAYHHCVEAGVIPKGVLSVFNYGFSDTSQQFKNENLDFYSLCTVEELLDYAQNQKTLSQAECDTILDWRNSF